jgi:hypothetical protein
LEGVAGGEEVRGAEFEGVGILIYQRQAYGLPFDLKHKVYTL